MPTSDEVVETSLDRFKQAIDREGYPWEMARVGECLKLDVTIPRDGAEVVATWLFGLDGTVVAPPEVSRLSDAAAIQPEDLSIVRELFGADFLTARFKWTVLDAVEVE